MNENTTVTPCRGKPIMGALDVQAAVQLLHKVQEATVSLPDGHEAHEAVRELSKFMHPFFMEALKHTMP